MGRTVLTETGRVPIGSRGFPFAPAHPSNIPITSPTGVSLAGGFAATYAAIYRSQPWVAIAVRKLAKAVGQLPLKTYTMGGEDGGDRNLVRPGESAAGEIARMFTVRPAPHLSPTGYKRFVVASRAVYGNFLAVKMNPTTPAGERGVGRPGELWPVPWHMVEVIEGVTQPVAFYVVTTKDGQRFPFTPDEVVHSATWSPDSPIGVSPLEPLRRTLALEDAAVRESLAAFQNGARPAGVFTSPNKVTQEAANGIRAELEKTHGGVDNAYRIAVLGGGLDWKPLAFSHVELELLGLRKMDREEIVAVYDMPPPMVGILDHATYSNITEQRRMLYADTLGPECVEIEEDHEGQLLQPEPEWAGLDLEFDMAEVLKADLSTRFTAYGKAIQLGFTPDEIRHLENMPPLGTEAAKKGYVQKNLTALDDEPEPAEDAARAPVVDLPIPSEEPPAADPEAATRALIAALEARSPNVEVRLPETPVTVQVPEQLTFDAHPAELIEAVAEANRALVTEMREMSYDQMRAFERLIEASKPRATVRKVERDAAGNMVRIIDEPVEETA